MRKFLQGVLGPGRGLLRARAGPQAAARVGAARFRELNVAPSSGAAPASRWSAVIGCGAIALAILPSAAAALGEAPPPDVDAEDLKRLAADLAAGSSSDREAAVSQASRLAQHPSLRAALLAAGCLDPLVALVARDEVDARVRVIALTSLADLLQLAEAREAAAGNAPLLRAVADCLAGAPAWLEGPGEGSLGRSAAARALRALLGSRRGLEAACARDGAAAALLARAAAAARESAEEGATFASLSAVPSTVEAFNSLARAVQALTGSDQGVAFFVGGPAAAEHLRARAGAGALAAAACTAERHARQVARAGGFRALVAALAAAADAQARCFACAAVSKVAEFRGEAAEALATEPGLAPALLAAAAPEQVARAGAVLQSVADAAADRLGVARAVPGAATVLSQQSDADGTGAELESAVDSVVRRGVQRCALKALLAASKSPQLAPCLARAGAVAILGAELEAGGYSGELESLARETVRNLASVR
ncbi:hypothetical protein QBZ16_001498 [Prototheca wickerhamii]|uniref:Uncharacterized protein n=1 Tax=Prototheca wickerhamii TaxID=3111 RepID=A0AAD9IGB7_PROWI|nr:hypothetical protein QBZ16_001498 [Prototheca wickerhamii]